MFSPIHHYPALANTAMHIIAPATAASTKLEKDTVYMPSSVAARVLGRASQESANAVNVSPEGSKG
ncbi:MAG: hypothetical protein JWN79_1929 [Gemmatimonadetes bacterium]|jgi:hypothetical protein|nr:hypothetical protein [Gemmatimonadota bacterium]